MAASNTQGATYALPETHKQVCYPSRCCVLRAAPETPGPLTHRL